MGRAVITASAPASMNASRGRYNARAAHRRKKQLEGELAMELLANNVPRPIPGDRVHATAELHFPTHRRRDAGNFRTPLEKALGDALAPHDPDSPHRWLSDDTPAQFTFGDVTFATASSPFPRAIVTLIWGDELAAKLKAEADALEAIA